MLFECPYEKLHFICGIKSWHFSPFSMIFPENLTISTLLWCRTIILTSVIQLLRKLSQVHLLDEGKANSLSLSLGFSVVSRYARLCFPKRTTTISSIPCVPMQSDLATEPQRGGICFFMPHEFQQGLLVTALTNRIGESDSRPILLVTIVLN